MQICETQTKTIDILNNQLTMISHHYPEYLEEKDVKYDVDCLKDWIESCRQGAMIYEEWFAEYGDALIKSIKQKILGKIENQMIQGSLFEDEIINNEGGHNALN